MKNNYKSRLAFFLIAIQQVEGADDIKKHDDLEIDPSCYITSPQVGDVSHGQITPAPYTSSFLEQMHPGSSRNEITGINQDRGEGLPYSTFLRIAKAYPDQYDDVIEKVQSLTAEGDLKEERILRIILAKQPDDFEKIIKQAAPFLEGITYGNYRGLILEAISNMPTSRREDLLKQVVPCLEGIQDGWEMYNVLKAISDIPEGSDDLLKQIYLYLKSIESGWGRGKFLNFISRIPLSERADLLAQAAPYIEGITDGNERAEFLGVLSGVPFSERDVLLRQASPYFIGSIKARILEVLSGVPFSEREDLLKRADSYLKCTTDGNERARIIKEFSGMSLKEFNDIFKNKKIINKPAKPIDNEIWVCS